MVFGVEAPEGAGGAETPGLVGAQGRLMGALTAEDGAAAAAAVPGAVAAAASMAAVAEARALAVVRRSN